jgi:hypothetical protein
LAAPTTPLYSLGPNHGNHYLLVKHHVSYWSSPSRISWGKKPEERKDIKAKLKDCIEKSLHREQADFRGHRSRVDQNSILCIIIERSMEYLTELYLVFVDFEKAFDPINRNKI